MSINHKILLDQIYTKLKTYTFKTTQHDDTMPIYTWKLIDMLIKHNPTDNFTIKGSKRDRHGLPKEKSLFGTQKGVGIPLGNITSQLFANIYLDPLDQYIKHVLKIKHYGRYMDDMVLIHTDKQVLLDAKHDIQEFLQKKLGLTLHPKKHYLQQSHKGVPFLGHHIYPRGYTLGKRTIKKRRAKTHMWNSTKKADYADIQSSVNSYLGMARHGKNYHLRKQMIRKLHPHIWNKLASSGGYKKLVFRTRTILVKRR